LTNLSRPRLSEERTSEDKMLPRSETRHRRYHAKRNYQSNINVIYRYILKHFRQQCVQCCCDAKASPGFGKHNIIRNGFVIEKPSEGYIDLDLSY
jgi:hypothetical protein